MLQNLDEEQEKYNISDTVKFNHKHITMPTVMPDDTVTAAAAQLMQALQTTN